MAAYVTALAVANYNKTQLYIIRQHGSAVYVGMVVVGCIQTRAIILW